MFERWIKDAGFTLRRLRKRRVYSTLAVLTLSLGVAGTAAVFSIARPLLLEPLPVRAEDRVVVFWMEGAWSEAEFASIRPDIADFQSVAAFRKTDATLREPDAPARQVPGISATAELFDVLGVTPALGPGFQPGDDLVGAAPVAVLSHSLWQELGGRASILEEQIEISGRPHAVVGVMPEGFWFPDPAARVWLSEEVNPDDGSGNYGLIARMPPGASVDAMDPEVGRITRLLGERFDYPEGWDLTKNPELTPLRDYVVGPVRPALLALLGAMASILLIACANVAALMLGQVDSRGSEFAVRSALGAGRQQLLRQLFVESAMIGALAGIAGAGLAYLGFPYLLNALPLGGLAETAAFDWSLFWVALGLALAAGTVVALAPGASVARSDLQTRLTSSRTSGIGGRGGRLEGGLVVAQVALVLLLAAGAGLLIRTVVNLRAIDPGVQPEQVAVVDVVMPVTTETARRPQLMGDLVAVIEALPGVESAASTQRLPLRGSSDNWGIGIEGRPDLADTATAFRVVTPGYFRAMGIEVKRGRGLLESDRAADVEEGVVVINEALAGQYFPGQDPIGRRIGFMRDRWDRIVGVVENVAESDLSPEPVPARYMVYEQVPYLLTGQTLVIRTLPGLDPAAILGQARRAIQATAPGVAVRELTTMERVVDQALGAARQVMSLLALLGGLALVLGTIGVYGVVSHFVTRRKRDWAIRIALGMDPPRVIRHVVGQGCVLVGTGIVLGLVAFLVLGRLLAGFLYGIGPADPAALAGAALVLLAGGVLAAYIPAQRASRVDPALALRDQ